MTSLAGKTITFIGSGAMGEAMVNGMLAASLVTANQLFASDPVPARRTYMAEQYGIETTDQNIEAVRRSHIVILSIKPQVLPQVAAELKGVLPDEALVISIMAGIPLAVLRQSLEHERIVRCMPNTPAQVAKGATVWTTTEKVSAEQKEQAASILGTLGVEIAARDESYLDMATGLSGSGPGFVFLVLEAMIDAGVQMGFSREDAEKLVYQTVDGSVELVRSSGLHPAILRNRVTSPGGTTAAGLFELEASGVRAAITRAILAAYKRSVQLGAAE